MLSIKDKFVALWLHFFLKRIGSKHPEFLCALLNDLNISKRQELIMKCRYINKLRFKEITGVEGVNCELRNVMREHKKVIDKLIHL